jgi:hypothetical protein
MAEYVDPVAYDDPVTPVAVQHVPAARIIPAKPIHAAPAVSVGVNNFEVLPEDSPNGQYDPPSQAKLKKRKKKLRRAKAETSVPGWIWLAGGLGALVTISGVIIGIWFLLKMNSGGGDQAINWTGVLLHFIIGMPISLVILIISMYASSALGGGIDFGEWKMVVIGGLFLIFIVNLVQLLPGGYWISFVVWLIGFMAIFGLDPWEARFLLLINWVLNFLIGMFVLHALLSGAVNIDRDIDDPPFFKEAQPQIPDHLELPNGIELPPGAKQPDMPPKNRKNDKAPRKPRPDILDDDDFGFHDVELHRRIFTWVTGRVVEQYT